MVCKQVVYTPPRRDQTKLKWPHSRNCFAVILVNTHLSKLPYQSFVSLLCVYDVECSEWIVDIKSPLVFPTCSTTTPTLSDRESAVQQPLVPPLKASLEGLSSLPSEAAQWSVNDPLLNLQRNLRVWLFLSGPGPCEVAARFFLSLTYTPRRLSGACDMKGCHWDSRQRSSRAKNVLSLWVMKDWFSS